MTRLLRPIIFDIDGGVVGSHFSLAFVADQ